LAEAIKKTIGAERLARIDYVQITDLEDLRPLSELHSDVLVALAVFIGTTRLIDNIRVRV
jgi:pantoate--beta-alanine ligase